MENPYATPVATEAFLGEPEPPQILAGFWMRVLASIIDAIWQMILVLVLGMAIYGVGYIESEAIVEGPVDVFISYVLPFLLILWFWMKKGATPGKMICGIRIVSEDGSPLTIGKCVIRYLGYLVSMIPLFLGYFWAAWDERNQTWHDKMARTLVVKAR